MPSNVSDTTERTKGPGAAAAAGRRRTLLVIGGAMAAVLLAVVVIAVFRGGQGPVKGDDPIALARFIRTPEFEVLPSEQKVPYMHSIRKQMPQIEAAHREGRIDGKAYRDAYLCTWMARRLDDMQDYYKQPAAKRVAWLDKQFAEDDDPPAAKTAAAKGSGDVSSDGGLLYDDAEDKAKFDEVKDEFEEEFLERWTPDAKRKWEEFRKVYKARRERARPGRAPGAATRASPTADAAR